MKSVPELLRDARQLHQRRRFDEAARIYRELLRIQPKNAEWIVHFAKLRLDQGRINEALAQFEKACAIDPGIAVAHYFRGYALNASKRFSDAADAFRSAYELKPWPAFALAQFAHLSRTICDWTNYEMQKSELTSAVRSDAAPIEPFTFTLFSDEPADLLACSRNYLADRLKGAGGVAPRAHRPGAKPKAKIRLGYLSADFRHHAITLLLTELIELHDRSKFEVVGISIGPDDKSPQRQRLAAAFDRFVDPQDWQLTEIGRKIHDLELDILIDLMGYTTGHQIEAIASRPAPVQVNFLGYPGTTGAEFVDYAIVDSIVAPTGHAPFFVEKLVHLPDCYQVNDRKRPQAKERPSRAECGLPENGFVFCCFNGNLKIAPPLFDIWMRLLRAAPESLLWLLESNEASAENLRRAAAQRSVDPARLVFAPFKNHSDHLARQPLADLFLDTLPYNAHTTASDALWMGVPIVTCMGESFAARVCASVLHAAGVPELVTHSLDEYAALALALAKDRQRLQELRARILRNRDSAPLFDTPRYVAHIESAFETMLDIWRGGEKPRAFAVEPISN